MENVSEELDVKVVLFCGGRGAATIIDALCRQNEIDLTVVVNAYDDGLSTGTIRRTFPGLLGPSDIRKNFSTILKTDGPNGIRIARLLEHRFDESESNRLLISDSTGHSILDFVERETNRVVRQSSTDLVRWTQLAIEQAKGRQLRFSKFLDGMCLGNLIFAGAFLESGEDFNRAIEKWTNSFELARARVLNISQGENLFLVGTKTDGRLLSDESEIVDSQSVSAISQIYLLQTPLGNDEMVRLGNLSLQRLEEELFHQHVVPQLNPEVSKRLASADLIVYGPGTQHSSLLPSFFTAGLGNEIANRSDIDKVYIGNLSADYDVQSETIETLLSKLTSYLNLGSNQNRNASSYVSQCFLSTTKDSFVPWGAEQIDASGNIVGVHVGRWSIDGLRHDGGRVANGLSLLARRDHSRADAKGYISVGIVIPVLNEVDRLPLVLERLLMYDWLGHSIVPEFVVVDGGSTDGSSQVVAGFPGVKVIRLPHKTSRGEALSAGFKSSRSKFIVTFPSDNEYLPDAIIDVVRQLRSSKVQVVFGSRTGFCVDTDKRLQAIYGGRTPTYYVSKWGGLLLSLLCGLFYKRWISDTLTSIKGINRDALQWLSLDGVSADWDVQLLIDAYRAEQAVAEVPVQYVPRSRKEGKKIRAIDGERAIWVLVRGLFER